jgi:hypothetical protein
VAVRQLAHGLAVTANLRAVEMKFDPTGQSPRRRRLSDQDEPVAWGHGERVLDSDVEVRPRGKTPGGGLATFLHTADLTQRAVQPVTVAVGRELVVEIEVEPVTAQADRELAGRRPDRNQPTELATRT